MNTSTVSRKSTARKEATLFLWLFLAGLFLLPLAVYVVGRALFGEYGGSGFSAFYGALHSELRNGVPSVWFLILSPYLIWQLFRLTVRAFKLGGAR
jgi:succinate dehydrogenase hydrophobic anchor subunit